MHIDKDLIEDKLYQIIYQFSKRIIALIKFYSILLNEVHSFLDGKGRKSKILFANDEIMNLVDETESINMMESQKN